MILNKSIIRIIWLGLFLFGGTLSSQNQLSSQNKPKLVVGIVVDQMRYDYLNTFSAKFGEQGFKRLRANGFSFDENYINYVPSNTAPGHATIATGSTPKQHGILNNSWFDKDLNQVVYCTYNKNVEPVGTGSKVDRNAPTRLLKSTLADVNKQATQERGKTISIAIKDRAAVLSGGKQADAAYWFRGKGQGGWISSDYYMKQLPQWVRDFNDSDLIERYMRVWEPLYPIESYSESGPDNSSVERGFKGKQKAVFPYDLKKLAPENGDYDLLRATPFGNSFTIDFALSAIKGEGLGVDLDTDFLLISLSSTDYIGHNFGIDSKEIEDAYLRLDRDIARFLSSLEILVGRDNYVLYLTSDHGAQRNPNFEKQDSSNDMRFFKEASFKRDLKEYVFEKYGTTELIQRIAGNHVYLNREILQNLDLDAIKVASVVKTYMRKNELIGSIRTRAELETETYSTGVDQLLQNAFHPQRSGDILYALRPGVVIYAKKGSSHGSPFGADTHVPLIFYGQRINKGSSEATVHPIDIAPTLGALLGLPSNPEWEGRILQEVLKK